MTMIDITPDAETADVLDFLRRSTWSDFAQSLVDQYDRSGRLSPKQWGAARSMQVKTEARQAVQETTERVIPADGFYFDAGAQQIIRVQKAKQSDNRYAKTLDVHDGRSLGWVYAGQRPFARCTDETRYSLDQAKSWGLAHGWCLVCGRELTDPKSVTAGIGPVCAKKF